MNAGIIFCFHDCCNPALSFIELHITGYKLNEKLPLNAWNTCESLGEALARKMKKAIKKDQMSVKLSLEKDKCIEVLQKFRRK